MLASELLDSGYGFLSHRDNFNDMKPNHAGFLLSFDKSNKLHLIEWRFFLRAYLSLFQRNILRRQGPGCPAVSRTQYKSQIALQIHTVLQCLFIGKSCPVLTSGPNISSLQLHSRLADLEGCMHLTLASAVGV